MQDADRVNKGKNDVVALTLPGFAHVFLFASLDSAAPPVCHKTDFTRHIEQSCCFAKPGSKSYLFKSQKNFLYLNLFSIFSLNLLYSDGSEQG